ncbi:hypothetical protein Syn7803US33_89 [Synechococcus phage ACG-2014e]|uniref:Uncharacterized protein n=1 Tax=Synechococcus phage ACG-2014e TaxID=1493510 RepID=A0A0E3FM46_9CAUD|nr:hypothetical protein Syn7803US33_89 [Synechococcus phage ACG-2014e]
MSQLNVARLNVSTSLTIPSYTTSQANALSATTGALIYNTDTDQGLQVWDGSEWVLLVGGDVVGSSIDNPATSAKEAFAAGHTGATVFIRIGSQVYEMEYDQTDRYGTGDQGWIKFDNGFFGTNNSTISSTKYGSPSTMSPAFNTNSTTATGDATISQGTHRIGRNQSHSGGNSLSTIRITLPAHTKVQYQASYVSGGNDTADFGTFTQNFSGIVNNSPYQNNGSGYWAVIYSGTAGSFANDMLIIDPGNLTSGNNSHSQNIGPLDWGNQRGTSGAPPQIIWGTTDAYREYRYTNSWTLWLH